MHPYELPSRKTVLYYTLLCTYTVHTHLHFLRTTYTGARCSVVISGLLRSCRRYKVTLKTVQFPTSLPYRKAQVWCRIAFYYPGASGLMLGTPLPKRECVHELAWRCIVRRYVYLRALTYCTHLLYPLLVSSYAVIDLRMCSASFLQVVMVLVLINV